MFFGKSNEKSDVSVNTTFYTSYSSTCLLTVGGWNRNLTVKFAPAVGKDSNGLTQYSTDNANIVNTVIREDNAIALLEGFKNIIEPAIKNGTDKDNRVSITMGQDDKRKCLTIGYDGKDAYVEICVGVKDDGTADDANTIRHVFNKKSYMVDYNHNDGSGEEVVTEADFFNFMKKIEKSQELVPMTAHSVKYSKACQKTYGKQSNYNSNNSSDNNYQSPTNVFDGQIGDFLPYS